MKRERSQRGILAAKRNGLVGLDKSVWTTISVLSATKVQIIEADVDRGFFVFEALLY